MEREDDLEENVHGFTSLRSQGVVDSEVGSRQYSVVERAMAEHMHVGTPEVGSETKQV